MDILLSIITMAIVLGITLYHRMSLVKSISLLTAAMLALTVAGTVGVYWLGDLRSRRSCARGSWRTSVFN